MQQFETERRGQSFCIISTVLKQSPKQAQELSALALGCPSSSRPNFIPNQSNCGKHLTMHKMYKLVGDSRGVAKAVEANKIDRFNLHD